MTLLVSSADSLSVLPILGHPREQHVLGDTGREKLRKDTATVHEERGAQAARGAAAAKDNARVGVDKVKLTLSASEAFGLLTITNELFHYRNRGG